MVAPVCIVLRNAYQDAFGAGLGVTELRARREGSGRDSRLMEMDRKKN